MADQNDRRQYAALPYVLNEGVLRILLVTSRRTRRWIVPKGWPEKGAPPHEVAAREAFEEAGVLGDVWPVSAGRFRYMKYLATGETLPCVVRVFPLKVERELSEWPEKGERARRWVVPEAAARLVLEPGLAKILRGAGAIVAKAPARTVRISPRHLGLACSERS